MCMIKITDLSYRVSKRLLLNRIELSLSKGEQLALAGANGVGKSTLIRIILNLIREIDSGSVLIDGLSNESKQAKSLYTYLPEKFDIKPEVSGWQYLDFVAGMYRLKRPENIEYLANFFDLELSSLENASRSYSKGMKQKLGLISCFMLERPLMILDEPLSGLDPTARYQFKQLLEQQRERGTTLFYSTHLLADAEEICDRLAILHEGKIVFDGSPHFCMQQHQAKTLEAAYIAAVSS